VAGEAILASTLVGVGTSLFAAYAILIWFTGNMWVP
jgi:hypothetical protein